MLVVRHLFCVYMSVIQSPPSDFLLKYIVLKTSVLCGDTACVYIYSKEH